MDMSPHSINRFVFIMDKD